MFSSKCKTMKKNDKRRRNLLINSFILITLLILTFSSISFSSQDYLPKKCYPGFEKEVRVRVVDNGMRPIEGAIVKIYYQVTSTITDRGEPKYAYTPEVLTNSSGIAEFFIVNREMNEDKLDCNIEIIVDLGSYRREEKINIEEMPKEVLIKMNAYPLVVSVKDQYGNPLNATMRIDRREKSFEGTGIIHLYPNRYELEVLYKDLVSKKYNVTINQDSFIRVVFPIYEVSLSIENSRGEKLMFRVVGENESYEGKTTLKIPSDAQKLRVEVFGEVNEIIEVPLSLPTKKNYEIRLDREAPEFEKIEIKTVRNETRVRVYVEDKGEYASGVEKVIATLTFEDDTILVREAENKGEYYEAVFNKVGNSQFSIRAYDKEGNERIIKGVHSVNKKVKEKEEASFEFDPIILGGIVIGLIILVGLYKYITSKFEGEL